MASSKSMHDNLRTVLEDEEVTVSQVEDWTVEEERKAKRK